MGLASVGTRVGLDRTARAVPIRGIWGIAVRAVASVP